MIITNIYGGLGNQMFQYAFGKSIAITQEAELKLDITSFKYYALRNFELGKFKLSYTSATNKELGYFKMSNKYNRFIIRNIKKYTSFIPYIYYEKQDFEFDPDVFNSKAIYFGGYWQSYKYFENIRESLLIDFILKDPLDKANILILDKIQNTNSVSLHIRRGDYLKTINKKGPGICPISYYEKAIKLILSKEKQVSLFIFSDDFNWIKENLQVDIPVTYIDFNYNFPERDLILMKNCKHNIIANSTFSWWGAWLNENQNKIVIAPDNWATNLKSSSDLIKSNWIKL